MTNLLPAWAFIALSTAGLVVIGAVAVKVFIAVRGLAIELERARGRFGSQHTGSGEDELR